MGGGLAHQEVTARPCSGSWGARPTVHFGGPPGRARAWALPVSYFWVSWGQDHKASGLDDTLSLLAGCLADSRAEADGWRLVGDAALAAGVMSVPLRFAHTTHCPCALTRSRASISVRAILRRELGARGGFRLLTSHDGLTLGIPAPCGLKTCL